MSKLVFNDDRTITVGLIAVEEETGREVLLREPSLLELAVIRKKARDADDLCPTVPVLDRATATPDEIEGFTKAVYAREDHIYSTEAPYGNVVLYIINTLRTDDGTAVSLNELPPWGANPLTARQIIDHYKAPLPGEE